MMTYFPPKWIKRNTSEKGFHKTINGYSNAFYRLLASRGMKDRQAVKNFLLPSLKQLYDPFLMPGIKKAVARIIEALKQKQRIFIFGDYDADGIISSALVYNFLGSFGQYPGIHIPDRVNEGYDLNIDFLKSVTGKADLIISVDCGTNNLKSQDYVFSNAGSPEVIACDHHNPTLESYNSDDRYIVVNPKLPGSSYPFQELSGGGVTFKFLIAVLRSLEEEMKRKFDSGYLKTLLDLVAISTLADLMPLLDENRILVKYGLERMQKTTNPGLKKLIEISLPDIDYVGEKEVSFILAPRLNAAGRVKDALDSFRLLADDNDSGDRIARELDCINLQRQLQQRETLHEIISRYDPASRIPQTKIFIEYSPHWNEGILGVVASDMVKTFNIPVILFRERNGILKGSGRSIEEFSLHRNLKELEGLFIRFGGHDLACGITMELRLFEEFREKMSALAGERITDDDLAKKQKYDIELEPDDIDAVFFEQIQLMRPFGKGNPCPTFTTRNCSVEKLRLLKDGKHIKMQLKKGSTLLEAIFFNVEEDKKNALSKGEVVDILYDLGINSWMGKNSVQLIIRDIIQKY